MAQIENLGNGKYICIRQNGTYEYFNVPKDGTSTQANQWAQNCQNGGGLVYLLPDKARVGGKSRFDGISDLEINVPSREANEIFGNMEGDSDGSQNMFDQMGESYSNASGGGHMMATTKKECPPGWTYIPSMGNCWDLRKPNLKNPGSSTLRNEKRSSYMEIDSPSMQIN